MFHCGQERSLRNKQQNEAENDVNSGEKGMTHKLPATFYSPHDNLICTHAIFLNIILLLHLHCFVLPSLHHHSIYIFLETIFSKARCCKVIFT